MPEPHAHQPPELLQPQERHVLALKMQVPPPRALLVLVPPVLLLLLLHDHHVRQQGQVRHAQLQFVHRSPPESHQDRLFLVSVVCLALQPQQGLRTSRKLCRHEHRE